MTSGEHQMARMQTDADLLREAARLMRERAENANEGPWIVERNLHNSHASLVARPVGGEPFPLSSDLVSSDARHIASWHPAVALAVAHHLGVVADGIEGERRGDDPTYWRLHETAALAVAHAYLGGAS